MSPTKASPKLGPEGSSLALCPVCSCQRWTITSTYFGSSSISRARRPVRSAAISVVPEPPNGSSTMSRLLDELRIARSTSATGFIVGCRSFFVRLVEEPHVALVAGAAPVVIGALLPAVQDRFVLALVIRPPEREGVLRPDHEGRPLAAGLAERLLQRVELRRRHADVDRALGHGQDVDAGVVEQARRNSSPRASFMIGRFLPRSLSFGRVGIVHVVRWIGERHVGEFAAQHLLDIGQHRGVAAQHAMLAADPQIAGPADRFGRRLGRIIGVVIQVGARRQAACRAHPDRNRSAPDRTRRPAGRQAQAAAIPRLHSLDSVSLLSAIA